MTAIWAGIDAGKTHHHCVAIDESGHRLLSRRVANDEPELLELLADVLALGDEVTWGIDLAGGGAALAITLLLNHDQPVLYLSGRAIHRASEGYRDAGKTDAKDAAVIADQARIRRAEGKRHTQAVLTLARRRVNVLWALLRDGRCYELTPPTVLAA
jgi:transposase